MVARAPAKAILAFPVFLFLVALALLLTARNVAAPSAPSGAYALPIVVVHTASVPQASSAPAADQASSPAGSSATPQPRSDTAAPTSKVKTGDGTDRASACTSVHCPR